MRLRLQLSLRMVALTSVMLAIPVPPVMAEILMVTTFKPSDG